MCIRDSYTTAAAAGKRVQALCEAKNHALVMEDCVLERTVAGIINSTYGCAGQRCMAPVSYTHLDVYKRQLQLLRRSDCFVARKIWPHANKLYGAFLTPGGTAQTAAEPNPGKIDRLFAKAVERRTKGRSGLYMQSRHPNENWENGRTAMPLSLIHI